jgi:hypothetical protein
MWELPLSTLYFPFAHSKRAVPAISSVAALITFAALGVGEVHADRIRASAAPPVFLWTDENKSAAQHVATSISDTFGTIHNFGPGTFIGGAIPLISSNHVPSEKDKSIKNGHAFGWTNAAHSNGSSSNSGSSGGSAGGVSSLVHQLSASGGVGGNGGAGAVVRAALNSNGSNNVGDTNGSVPLIANPLPGALPLFATGLGVLGLLGWRRKRRAQAA